MLWTLGVGVKSLNRTSTDPGSERNTVKLLKSIDAGSTRAMMSGYTRFPPGPAYVLSPFWELGARRNALRMVPVVVSAIAYFFVFFSLLKFNRSWAGLVWVTAFGVLYALQPAYCNWQGALYEHSFGHSFLFLTLACAASSRFAKPESFLLLGFFSGWMGYSSLPAQVCALAAVRVMVLLNSCDLSVGQAFVIATRDAAAFVCGVLWSIIFHFIQTWAYYGYMDSALIDLFSSALQRAGMMSYKIYIRFYPAPFAHDLGRVHLIYSTFNAFLRGYVFPWSHEELFYIAPQWFYPTLVALFVALAWRFVQRPGEPVPGPIVLRRSIIVAVGLVGTALASVMWIILMRFHAGWHFYYTARHFIIGFFVLGLIPALVGQERRSSGVKYETAPRVIAVQIAKYAAPGVALILLLLFWTRVRISL